jgi:hypothetical protein
MDRQCAWCLRLMNRFGEPISAPQPKRYEISHGMCLACGALWLEQAVRDTDEREAEALKKLRADGVEEETI